MLNLVTAPAVLDPAPTFASKALPTAGSAQWRATSLFSGGGGLDLGFLAEGIHSGAAFDTSRAAVATYNRNLPPSARIADLSRFTPEVDGPVMLAGAPCQGFSTVGKRLLEDPRNDLLSRVADIAIDRRPKALVIENVPAALSGAHARHWHALEARLRLAGYNVRRVELKGEESGIAQRRRRLFLICWIGSDCLRLDLPPVPHPTLRETLAGISALADHVPVRPTIGSVDARVSARIGPGQKVCNVRSSERAVPTWAIPEVFGETTVEEQLLLQAVARLRRRARRRNFGDGDPVAPTALALELGRPVEADLARLVEAGYLRRVDHYVELRHTYNGKYRRLDWSDLSPTVDTHFGRAALFLHPDEDRGLSAREAARIQGFPDAYQLVGNRADQFGVIGNAVPPPMGARIARFVREAILKA